MKRTHALLAALLPLAACTQSHSESPQTATGETPIRYVLCSQGDTYCFVAARFKDFEGCEAHRQWSEMLCEDTTDGMHCERDDSKIVTSYCTK